MLAITGPTASGKSSLAIAVAEHVGGDIVSVDSRQVYRGLSIGTAAPTQEDLARVPHHLVGSQDPHAPLSAGAYAELVGDRIDAILAAGREPILVGGSMLYLDAVTHGLSPALDLDTRFAVDAMETATLAARQRLFDELAAADPDAAATLDPSKTQRLARLVGVLRVSGRRPSDLWAERQPPRHAIDVVVVERPRDELYRRIDTRVDAMLAGGLLDENRQLLADGLRLDRPPMKTIGYAEPIAHLEGAIGYDEMVRLLKRNTRRYAKRQLTWLRRRDYDRFTPGAELPRILADRARGR